MKNWFIIISIVVLLTTVTIFKMHDIKFKLAARKLLKKYPRSIVENVERIYRLETNHFKSGQYKKTYSPGMEMHSDNYPYGWTGSLKLWSKNPHYKPIGFVTMREGGTNIPKTFLKFASLEAAMFTLADYLSRYNNNPGRWYSLNQSAQERYLRSINKITPHYTDEIT